MSKHITHGYHTLKGQALHDMEDYVFAQFKQFNDNELGLFAIYDGHLSHDIPDYLRSHLFENILNEVTYTSCVSFYVFWMIDCGPFIFLLHITSCSCSCDFDIWIEEPNRCNHCFSSSNQPDFWTETEKAIRRAYRITDKTILDKAVDLGKGGSTAVTAILINCRKLVVANVGDSRAVICKNGVAKQLSIDHEPNKERRVIETKGGFVSNFPGNLISEKNKHGLVWWLCFSMHLIKLLILVGI